MTKILAISGRKQSGKDTNCNFLVRNAPELFNTNSIKKYYFADELKKFCRDYFDVPEEWLWGTDADKNRLTKIKWNNLPHAESLKNKYAIDFVMAHNSIEYLDENLNKEFNTFMTVRELLQQVGTDIFRKMYENIWVNSCLRVIRKENFKYALIADMRFPNEADAIKSEGGILLRLTRKITDKDIHTSETALDNYQGFDKILDNSQLGIDESYNEVVKFVKEIGF